MRRCEQCNQDIYDESIFPHICNPSIVLAIAVEVLADVVKILADKIERQERTIRHILRELEFPDHLNVTLNPGGTLNPNDQATINVVESSSKTGATFPVVQANLQYAVADSTIATVTPVTDGPAVLTALAEGTTTLTVTDSSNGLVGTATVTVSAGGTTDAPDTLTVTLTPIVPGVTANAKKSGAKLV